MNTQDDMSLIEVATLAVEGKARTLDEYNVAENHRGRRWLKRWGSIDGPTPELIDYAGMVAKGKLPSESELHYRRPRLQFLKLISRRRRSDPKEVVKFGALYVQAAEAWQTKQVSTVEVETFWETLARYCRATPNVMKGIRMPSGDSGDPVFIDSNFFTYGVTYNHSDDLLKGQHPKNKYGLSDISMILNRGVLTEYKAPMIAGAHINRICESYRLANGDQNATTRARNTAVIIGRPVGTGEYHYQDIGIVEKVEALLAKTGSHNFAKAVKAIAGYDLAGVGGAPGITDASKIRRLRKVRADMKRPISQT